MSVRQTDGRLEVSLPSIRIIAFEGQAQVHELKTNSKVTLVGDLSTTFLTLRRYLLYSFLAISRILYSVNVDRWTEGAVARRMDGRSRAMAKSGR